MTTMMLRAAPAYGIDDVTKIDREAGIIYGYSVATVGTAMGHNADLDETTIKQIVEYGNSEPKGIKARFTHPNMSSDGAGKFLGRSKNFRVDGPRARADLYFAKVSAKSPKGNLRDYVMDLAVEDPDAFGASVVIPEWKPEKRLNADGTAAKGADGKELNPLIRVTRLKAVDIVDDPAANSGLFSENDPAANATAILNSLFATATPDEIRARAAAFTDRYLTTRFGDQLMSGTITAPAPVTAPVVPAVAPVVTEPTPAPLDLSAVKAEAALAERKRGQDILALCATAGLPDQAKTMIEAGFSVDQARTELFDAMCRKNKVLAGDTTSADQKPPDENATFAAEWDKDQATFSRAGIKGITKEAYIRSRRVSEGLEELVVGGAA